MKRSQLDRAIDTLTEKKAGILAEAQTEANALDHAIQIMKLQRATKRSKGPKAVVAEKASA